MAMYACQVTTSAAADVMAQVKKMRASIFNGSCLVKNVTEQGGLHPLLRIDDSD